MCRKTKDYIKNFCFLAFILILRIQLLSQRILIIMFLSDGFGATFELFQRQEQVVPIASTTSSDVTLYL